MEILKPFEGKRVAKELAKSVKSPGPWLRAERWKSTDPFPGLSIAKERALADSNGKAPPIDDLQARKEKSRANLERLGIQL
jgi:hypothetical protein